jgi:hypothetical protein
MSKQYLHLSAYVCDKCGGPVVAGSLGVRESEISKETNIRHVGAICLTCGHRQSKATEPARARHLTPMEWQQVSAIGSDGIATAAAETVSRAELR